jgi:PAS domain S-box-containing protein
MDRELLDYWRAGPRDPIDALFDLAPVLAHSIDAEGRLLRVSRRWADLLGYAPAEMVGRRSIDFLTEESRRRAVETVLPAFRASGFCHNVAYDFVRRDGTVVPVLMSATSELDREGRFLRSLAFLTDMRETRSVLAALERKAEEAEEASLAKSRFLAAMSHEIRTPMNAILGFAQILELSDLGEEDLSHVRAILSAGGALMALLRDLLDLAQVEAGYMRIERRGIDLYGLVDETAEFWQGPARERGLRFDVTLDRGLPRQVISDPVRIRQVLNNYLGNAIKFTETGRIGLRVERHPDGAAAPGAAEGRPVIRFTVSDTGPGIAPEDVDRLFLPFVQGAPTGEDRPGGWGLGLSICSNIAAAMGAQVGVETGAGHGAAFRFDLPVSLPAPEPGGPAEPPGRDPGPAATVPAVAAPRCAPLRVLLAEDNALNQDVMHSLLRDLGHEVETVANGFEAVEAVAARRFDVVIMDIMMPGLDGAAAAARIRASMGPSRDVPLVACSAHVAPEAQERYRALGMTGFLPKPVDRGMLQAVLAAAVPESRAAAVPETG